MKKVCTLFMVIILAAPVFAQNWIELKSKTSRRLNDVYFFNRDTGVVCGDKGLILRTVNGGFNWTPVQSGVTEPLAYLHFYDKLNGFATGYVGNGTLLKTTDGGKTWSNASLNIPDSRSGSIFFLNQNTGYYAFGNKFYQNSRILKTTNGGASWDTVFRTSEWVSFLFFTDENHGYATATGSNVYYTKDGGNTWDTAHFTCDMFMSGIYFINADTGFVGGLDMGSGCFLIMRTTDGGYSWSSISDHGAARIFFYDNLTGFAIAPDTSGNSKLLKTTNGGDSFYFEPTPREYLSAVHFPELSTGYCVGDSGVILRYSRVHTIKGKVTTPSSAPVNQGTVRLIAFSNGQRSVELDTAMLDANGEYMFSLVQSGRYILLAQADTMSFPDAAPTYFGNSVLWNNAQIIYLSAADTVTCDITMVENNTIPVGTASISGIVESLDGTRAGTNPIKDVDVTLKKVPGGQIKKTKTDDNGFYKFDKLPVGDYNIFIDIPGLPMDSIIPVKIADQDSSVKNVNFGVDSTGIHVDLSLSSPEALLHTSVRFYPNPSNGTLVLELKHPLKYQVEISDLQGKTISSYQLAGGKLHSLDISYLAPSVYLLRISNAEYSETFRLIKNP